MDDLITFIEVKFETSSSTPPPFCYYYHLKSEYKEGKWITDFDWKYHNREDMTIEEIVDEGFSENDDFQWNGEINSILMDEILKRKSSSKILPEKQDLPDEQNYFSLTFAQKKDTISGVPKNQLEWEYFMQEIIQGIYEIAEKEAPLKIITKEIAKNNQASELEIVIHFSSRTADLTYKVTGKPDFLRKEEDWEYIKKMISLFYELDYNPDKALKKEPKNLGEFINIGDGLWYEINKSVRNISRNSRNLEELKEFLEDFIH